MKLYWTGTDSLMLTKAIKMRTLRKRIVWYIFRFIVRLLDKFYIEGHYVDDPLLQLRLESFGVKKSIKVLPDYLKHIEKYDKKDHKDFNVLYYMPKKTSDISFWKTIYGYDIYSQLKKELPQVNFIVVDGTFDMSKIYPIVDFYLRPNRSDGASRMRRECEIQKIPYYWTQVNPDISKAKQEIIKEYENKFKKKTSV